MVWRARVRFYVAGVFVAAPFGAYIQYFQERMVAPRSFSIAGAVDAILWIPWTTRFAFFCFSQQSSPITIYL